MKHIISFILAALLPVVASAFDAEVNGIYYNLSGDQAVVTYMEYDPLGATFTPGYKGNVSLPTSVTYDGKTYSVTKIGNYAFAECKNLTSVTIPETVTSIGEGAFSECSGLTSVTIGDGVTSIDDEAFKDCASLTSVTIPNSMISIGGSAFRGCKGLTDVIIPDGVTSIGGSAFQNCSGLTSVPYGNVKVENGCKLNIRNRKSVLIKNRFECKLGGELQIK